MFNLHKIAQAACLSIAITAVGGCMSDRHDEIPPDAMIPATGNKQLEFTASEPGMVYVFDQNNDRLIYSGKISRGEMMVVSPDDDRISINGRTVREQGIRNANSRRIFFKAMPPTEERVIIEERRSGGR